MDYQNFVFTAGASFGALAVIFGAFGAHVLKKRFTPEMLNSFETGIKYQMYHAIVLVVLGFNLNFSSKIEQWLAICFILGIFFFSFSIYGLCLCATFGKKLKILGPITPIGGLLLLVGWILLLAALF